MYSVLLPARDAERTVGLALRSTLRALPRDAELLVFDDASTDSTPDVVAAIARTDKRVVLERSSTPTGVATALNFLLEASRGEYIARMDADDASFPWRFRAQGRALHAGADAVFSTRVNFGHSLGSFRPAAQGAITANEMPYWLAISNPVPHSSMAARRELLVDAGGYSLSPAEDYELWLRLASNGARIVRLGLPVLAYRMHEAQVTKGGAWRTRYVEDPALSSAHTELLVSLGWGGGSVWGPLARINLGEGVRPDDGAHVSSLGSFIRASSARALSRGSATRLMRATRRLV